MTSVAYKHHVDFDAVAVAVVMVICMELVDCIHSLIYDMHSLLFTINLFSDLFTPASCCCHSY